MRSFAAKIYSRGGPSTEFWFGRIRIAHLESRKPKRSGQPHTPEAPWAPLIETFEAPNYAISGILPGAVWGHADVSYAPILPFPGFAFLGFRASVEYFDYSDDGRIVLNGTELSCHVQLQGPWQASVDVSGCSQGSLEADLQLQFFAPAQGNIVSELDGERFEGVPNP